MSITRLEPSRQFVDRMVLLNRFHTPDEDDYSGAHHVLGEIHRGFPRTDAADQAAYLVSAVVKGRPFSEANFRTAWDYVADLLDVRGYDLQASLKEAQDLGNTVWDMAEDDGLHGYLREWFGPRIHALARQS